MIEFVQLSVKDFGCFKKAALPLRQQGLVLILGENRDTAAADSNGSGKSTVFKAMSWVLFGLTVDNLKGDEVIRSKAKAVEVVLDFAVDGKEYTAVRTKTRGKAESLRVYYTQGRKSLGHRTLKDAQSALEELLSLDWLAFRNTVLYGQGDILHFADPRTTDTQRKAVITKILRLEQLDVARKAAREAKNAASAKEGVLEGEVKLLKARLDTLGVGDLKASSTRWEDERANRVKAAKQNLDAIKAGLKQLKTAQARFDTAEARLEAVAEILDEMDALSERKQALRVEWTEMTGPLTRFKMRESENAKEHNRIQARIHDFTGGNCPTCGTPTTGLHVKRTLTQLRSDQAKNKTARTLVQAELEKVRAERERMSCVIDDLEQELTERPSWLANKEKLERTITEQKVRLGRKPQLLLDRDNAKIELGRVKGEPNPYESQIAERQQQAADTQEQIDQKATEAKREHASAAQYDFWVDGFGPAGLPSYLMDSVVPVVAGRANRYLEILADGDLKVKIDTQATLKGGGVRERLDLTTVVEGQIGVPLSGGQLKKTTLACDLALMDLLANREGASVDMLLLDEVLDGLDGAGKARVMDLLEHLRGQRSTIIVISHDPEIVEKFGKTVTAVKSGGIATLKS
jgi:DNA repair exonuclease SbcCD ATPase subunit